MKNIFVILLIGLLFYECKSQKEITYELPKKISKLERKKIVEDFGKGKILFINHCAECHGIFVNGKESIPDFSKPQIYNYHVMLLSQDKITHKSAKNLSMPQLNYILTFLLYKKTEKPTAKK
jgi:cytochrome c